MDREASIMKEPDLKDFLEEMIPKSFKESALVREWEFDKSRVFYSDDEFKETPVTYDYAGFYLVGCELCLLNKAANRAHQNTTLCGYSVHDAEGAKDIARLTCFRLLRPFRTGEIFTQYEDEDEFKSKWSGSLRRGRLA